MRNHANVFTLIVVATTLLVLGGTPGFGAAQQKVVTWKYMGNEIVNTPQLGLMTEFGAKITEATGGRVKVTTYGHDELPYKATDTMKVLNDNLVQIAQMPHVWSVGDIPVVVVTDLPFLARTKQQQDKYYATIEPFVAAAFEKRFNVKAIAYVDYDRRQIVSGVPTRSLRDLKGQKIRVIFLIYFPFQICVICRTYDVWPNGSTRHNGTVIRFVRLLCGFFNLCFAVEKALRGNKTAEGIIILPGPVRFPVDISSHFFDHPRFPEFH